MGVPTQAPWPSQFPGAASSLCSSSAGFRAEVKAAPQRVASARVRAAASSTLPSHPLPFPVGPVSLRGWLLTGLRLGSHCHCSDRHGADVAASQQRRRVRGHRRHRGWGVVCFAGAAEPAETACSFPGGCCWCELLEPPTVPRDSPRRRCHAEPHPTAQRLPCPRSPRVPETGQEALPTLSVSPRLHSSSLPPTPPVSLCAVTARRSVPYGPLTPCRGGVQSSLPCPWPCPRAEARGVSGCSKALAAGTARVSSCARCV